MAHWLEDLTRTMADKRIGRRMAIRRVAGTVVAVAIASALPVNAEAKRKRECPIGGDCSLDVHPAMVTPILIATVSSA